MNEPRVHKSELLQSSEHEKELVDGLLLKITKYSLGTFKQDPDSFVRITIDPDDNKIVLAIFASDDYYNELINCVRSAILSENLIIIDELFSASGRYHIKLK